MMKTHRKLQYLLPLLLLPGVMSAFTNSEGEPASSTAAEKTIGISLDSVDGSYTVFDPQSQTPVLHSSVAAEVNHRWLKSGDYPRHLVSRAAAAAERGSGIRFTVVNSGLAGQPDLVYFVELHGDPDYATVLAQVRNQGSNPLSVQALRPVQAIPPAVASLGGPDASDRVLSDSFSEDRPAMTIRDLGDAENGMHRAVGSQLIYNRESKRSLFLGALTSDKWLTIVRLHVTEGHPASYEVDSAGTTELEKENSLQSSPADDQIELSLPVVPGGELSSEELLIATGGAYHQQLENYGHLIRRLHHARVARTGIAGWWSWTAYYFGLNQDTALTNATWLGENLKDLGYNFFHIDEGYQYARGEYTTPDASLFPRGMSFVQDRIRALGLTGGAWTAPFEVSDRSWVYQNHKDWLVHNAHGEPIHAGWVNGEKRLDPLYVLDTTNPGAQDYLRQTYTTLARDWGLRYIKLDFMDDSAIEGYYHRPNTTALEAQRIGLDVIRQAVGDEVVLDKDGSPMLNPVGIVDTGRISVDTGHTFQASKEAAPGIAARYYMNGNFYVDDPDAFTVSRQTVDEQEWHGGKRPLSLDEARVSIALAAIAGGMYEIGDDLPTLGADPDRVSLVKNRDLLDMARLGRASLPLDLMSYTSEDGMPSIFLLRESRRQAILTVFNWSEKPTSHDFEPGRDLGLPRSRYRVVDIFNTSPQGETLESIRVQLPPHSVKVLKIIDAAIPAAAPAVGIHLPDIAETGEAVQFSAEAEGDALPVVNYRWNFGDGTTANGATVHHAYTRAGEFTVRLEAEGVDDVPFDKSMTIRVSGKINTRFEPASKKRPAEPISTNRGGR
ncbi:MAG: PKD domain-containing protein [Acidobacteria bacterium]|nr:PKD domain-containing protein [Acidobacteriota bacterium]